MFSSPIRCASALGQGDSAAFMKIWDRNKHRLTQPVLVGLRPEGGGESSIEMFGMLKFQKNNEPAAQKQAVKMGRGGGGGSEGRASAPPPWNRMRPCYPRRQNVGPQHSRVLWPWIRLTGLGSTVQRVILNNSTHIFVPNLATTKFGLDQIRFDLPSSD